jgi:hypothetical protein
MSTDLSFQEFSYTLPPNRQLLAAKFVDKSWFRNTDLAIQKQLLSLPDDHEGFVFDLSNRPDHIGDIDVLRLERFVEGDFLVVPVFNVYSRSTQKTFSKEYVSWKMGKHPGLKGLLFVEKEDKIKYFITIEADKFPVGGSTYDAIGGLFQYSKEQIVDLPREIEKSIKDRLGLKKINVKRFIDLGRIQSDNGLTINTPSIFAAIVDGQEAENIVKVNKIVRGQESLEYKINIVPIEQLDQYISKVDDSFFLAIISRLLAKKIISL